MHQTQARSHYPTHDPSGATPKSWCGHATQTDRAVNAPLSLPVTAGKPDALQHKLPVLSAVMAPGSRMDKGRDSRTTVPAGRSFEERQLERVRRAELSISQASELVAAMRRAS